jgi:hypothetical protein
MAVNVPLLDTGRIQRELGWTPRVGAADALVELLEGLAAGAEGPTPALARNPEPPHEAEDQEAKLFRARAPQSP